MNIFKLISLYIAIFFFFTVDMTWGGEFHTTDTQAMTCADCHTMHYMEGGTPPTKSEAGGPWNMLLLYSTTTKLCLMCHDGSDANAPDVIHPVTMYNESGDEYSGAGFFSNSGGSISNNGHNLDYNAPNVPFSSLANISLNCASCHDPHGTENYRNLLSLPKTQGQTSVILNTDVYENKKPPLPPSQSGAVLAYKKSNMGYKAKMSIWCKECHSDLNDIGIGHHPTDVPINGMGYHTDPAHWVAGSGSGFGLITGDNVEGIPRLRFQVTQATDYNTSKVVAENNQVFCGTCHLAHGGAYKYGMAWPYAEGGENIDKNSGCQQCHNK